MGADIYLQSVFEAHAAACDAEVEELKGQMRETMDADQRSRLMSRMTEAHERRYQQGYFRDSYNDSCMAPIFGFSWWRQIAPRLQNSRLPIDEARAFVALLEAAGGATERKVRERLQIDEAPPDEAAVADGVAYFDDKRKRLIALLNASIEKGEPLLMSL